MELAIPPRLQITRVSRGSHRHSPRTGQHAGNTRVGVSVIGGAIAERPGRGILFLTSQGGSDMPRLSLSMLMSLALGLAACADSSYQVVEMPQRAADLYPVSQTRSGVTVAIDEIRSPDRAEKYFGTNLMRHRVLPLAIIISNNSEHQIVVTPADVLLHQGTQVIDPVPLPMVVAMAEAPYRLNSKTLAQVNQYFQELAFTDVTLPRGANYQGVIFFSLPRHQRPADDMSILPLFSEYRMRVLIGVRDTENQARQQFGPFSLSYMENTSD
jgi:hypothetical protein